MSVTIREIKLFVAAYEARSFTAAAVRENASQSGVSQHIRKTEERFRTRLFQRSSGSATITPTPAGDAYYRKCLDVLRAHDAALQNLRHFSAGLDGEVVIGLMPTITRSVLAPALARFVESHPNVSLSIAEAYSGELTERVTSGALAFAVVPAFPSGASLRTRLFARTPEVLVTSRQQPQYASLAERSPLKLVLPGRQNTRRQTIDTYLASNNISVDRLLELDSMFGTLDLVARTDWVAILPGLLMSGDRSDDAFTVTPLAKPPLWLDLVLIESPRRILSPAEQAFLDVLKEEIDRAN